MFKKLLLCTVIVLGLQSHEQDIEYHYLENMAEYLDVLYHKPEAIELTAHIKCSHCGHDNKLLILLSR